jgi:hypothetical protein
MPGSVEANANPASATDSPAVSLAARSTGMPFAAYIHPVTS